MSSGCQENGERGRARVGMDSTASNVSAIGRVEEKMKNSGADEIERGERAFKQFSHLHPLDSSYVVYL